MKTPSRTIPRFNVLDRHQPVHRHIMLEASAGTGKTFAIENLLVRLLIETGGRPEPMPLNRILVVTFTRAAARDLKVRIRANLEQSLSFIKRFLANEIINEPIPDYLLMHRENGSDALIHAQRRIESALFTFDQVQVFTIHGFCWRMLQTFAIESGISLELHCSEEKTLSKTKLLQVVRDFLRTELIEELYSPQQINRVLQLFSGQCEKLQLELLQIASRGMDIALYPSYSDHAHDFFASMKSLKAQFNFSSEKILSDFKLHVLAYRGICNRSKQINPAIWDPVVRFAQLFDRDNWTNKEFDGLICDGLVLLEVLAPEQLAAKGVLPSKEKLHYPELLPIIEKVLAPVINQARDPHKIFARMARDCQAMLRHFQGQEEMLGFNDLLQQMHQAANIPTFVKRVRNSFDAVIVDEFQDTDPMQWEIFCKLFAVSDWPGHMYLVGDPKQSIYAFRQADIYTYLSAAQTLEEKSGATLDTNYRSHPPLVKALNDLFESAQELFPLPRYQQYLLYRAVKAGKIEEKQFSDQGACLQFLLAQPPTDKKKKIPLQEYEDAYFFPAIANEIINLHLKDGVKFNQCAILVADRFQAERLLDFFHSANIPAISQRGNSLSDSSAVHIMRELLQGILHYRQNNLLRVALGGCLLGFTHAEILAMEELKNYEKILLLCEQLQTVFFDDGFASFYPQLMNSCWHNDGKSILERLLEQDQGVEFYQEWQDLAELLMQEQARKNLSSEGVISFLDELEILAENEDERVMQPANQEKKGVIVLTSHVSKGLEFDIVFSLGLIKRPPRNEKLMPVQRDNNVQLEALGNEKDLFYKKYCEELDAEKMRQLYVAFTRAKYRLYIPITINHSGENLEHGAASPIEIFLARLGNKAYAGTTLDYIELYERIKAYDISSLYHFVREIGENISITILEKSTEKINFSEQQEIPELLPPPAFKMKKSPVFMQSFTSLAVSKKAKVVFHEEIIQVPHDFNAPMKTPHTLPAGNETGKLLHAIFEIIPFDAVKNMENSSLLLPWVRPILRNTLWEPWSQVFMDIVYKALKTPLISGERSFCLADVDSNKMKREADFLFTVSSQDRFKCSSLQPGYIKGVVDLFFEHEGKYFLLDWKSNWLGPSEKDYHDEKVEAVMEENDYHLQAQIYIEALRKYIKIFDERPFEMLFGGVYYLFLRGISSKTGIWNITCPP